MYWCFSREHIIMFWCFPPMSGCTIYYITCAFGIFIKDFNLSWSWFVTGTILNRDWSSDRDCWYGIVIVNRDRDWFKIASRIVIRDFYVCKMEKTVSVMSNWKRSCAKSWLVQNRKSNLDSWFLCLQGAETIIIMLNRNRCNVVIGSKSQVESWFVISIFAK